MLDDLKQPTHKWMADALSHIADKSREGDLPEFYFSVEIPLGKAILRLSLVDIEVNIDGQAPV